MSGKHVSPSQIVTFQRCARKWVVQPHSGAVARLLRLREVEPNPDAGARQGLRELAAHLYK